MPFLTPNARGERDVTLAFLMQQFAQARSSVYGLDQQQLHTKSSVSDFTPASVLRHLTQVADGWAAVIAAAPEVPAEDSAVNSGGDFTVAASTTLDELLADYDRSVAALADVAAAADLDAAVPVPDAPWYPPDLKTWEVRWVLHQLLAEVARHAGHADIVRESIDGKQSYELNARADGELADDEEFPTWA